MSLEDEEDEDLLINVYKTLIAILEAKIKKYPTDIKTDYLLLSNKSKTKITNNQRMKKDY